MKPSRSQEFIDILDQPEVCMKSVRELCFHGCPFEGSFRAKCWKLMLNYLSPKQAHWEKDLALYRNNYKNYIEEFIGEPTTEQGHSDHPLSAEPDSQWAAFFRDNEMLLQVNKDCRRLCPDLHFFQQATEFPCNLVFGSAHSVETLRKRVEYSVLQSETLSRSRMGITNLVCSNRSQKAKSGRGGFGDDDLDQLAPGQEAHWEVVQRVLFIYCKTNHAQSYVQGMNEVMGPIYYVFATDPDPHWRRHAEADSFFCFYNLMTEIQSHFIKSLDHDYQCGISGRMKQMESTLQQLDYTLSMHMKQQRILPEYYAFRWITLLLSQEFNLPDVLRVWDSLLSDESRFDFLLYVCCAMLISIRDELMNDDFSNAIRLLQNVPVDDVHVMLAKATELYRNRHS